MLKAISARRPPDLLVKSSADSLVFLRIPKVASTAMTHYLNGKAAKPLGRKDSLKYPDRVAFLRHPVERLKSAYMSGWVKKGKPVPPFEEWWEHVRVNPSWDIHTMPQSVLLQSHATEVYQIEEIGQWWPLLAAMYPFAFDANEPVRTNESRSADVSVSDEVYAEIMEIYAEDYERWLSASVSSLEERFRRDPASQPPAEPSASDEPPSSPSVHVAPAETTPHTD